MSPTPVIFWFRRDLRLADNPALVAACAAGDGHVAATFVIDTAFAAPAGATRVDFLRRSLRSLDASIEGHLTFRRGDPAQELTALASETRSRLIVATQDFGPGGRARDECVRTALAAKGIEMHYIDSPYVVAPGTVRTTSLTPCRVFGAFQRRWELEATPAPLDAPSGVTWHRASGVDVDELTTDASTRRPWYFGDLADEVAPASLAAGEGAAHDQLAHFVRHVDAYRDTRDRPAIQGTSRLSAHLRFGSIHPRQVLHVLHGAGPGRATFRSEICWREFYADVLWHHPESAREVLQPSLEHLRVDVDAAAVQRFHTWARGETGYPLVDAGMRQLLTEGWMHNRVRMVCASFLVKHLHLDWRWGARWFMWRLVDADLASNQHGWQWTAGTGTDAAPFHRVFNPTLQAQRFDESGDYVRQFVSELARVPAPLCLQPGAGGGLLAGAYPAPMIDAAREREEALARYAEAREVARVAR